MSRIFGYASPHPFAYNPRGIAIPRVDEQVSAIEQKSDRVTEETGAEWAGCRTESEVAVQGDWGNRPQLGRLVKEVTAGDHLILWDPSRLSWNFAGMVEAIGYVIRKGACLHLLRFGNGPLDLNQHTGPRYLQLLEAVAEMSRVQHQWQCEYARRTRESGDVALGCAPPFGKRRMRPAKGQYRDVWCPKQCALIREIKQRHDAGESFKAIAEDFRRRKLKRGSGALWARRCRKHGKWTTDASQVAKAYHWYEALLAQGEDLGA